LILKGFSDRFLPSREGQEKRRKQGGSSRQEFGANSIYHDGTRKPWQSDALAPRERSNRSLVRRI
jgi:hypothetical protein